MEKYCSFCGTEAKESQLFAVLNGSPQSRICPRCYFIAIDLGYSVVYADGDTPPIPQNLVL